jgi:hypothetical protein
MDNSTDPPSGMWDWDEDEDHPPSREPAIRQAELHLPLGEFKVPNVPYNMPMEHTQPNQNQTRSPLSKSKSALCFYLKKKRSSSVFIFTFTFAFSIFWPLL